MVARSTFSYPMESTSSPASRRQFLKSGSIGAASLIAAPYVARGQGDASPVKVGLVGCGGRGSGAASQALNADKGAVLWSMGDAFDTQLKASLNRFEGGSKGKAGQVQVAEDRRFVGLDAFQKVIESGVDVVILATPPGFRPQHLRAAIEAGKHVFCEKPMAVDVPGVRSVMESAQMAKAKGTNLVSGFCWRYSTSRREAMDRVLGGDIGDVRSYYATYYTGPVKPMPPATARSEGISDVEWQVRNWYNFSYLGGDSLVEQAVHSVDKVSWAMGDQPPISAVANGGRTRDNNEGNIFDHFSVVYEYANGALGVLSSRQIPKCFNENADYIVGSNGRCVINGGRVALENERGKEMWRFRSSEDNDMYQEEHNTLFKAIRKGEVVNDGDWMATSTMLGILGRLAAYTGQRITWEQALQSTTDLAPDSLKMSDSFDPGSLPQPGVTKFA